MILKKPCEKNFLFFPCVFYTRDKKEIYYVDSVSSKLSQEVIEIFYSIQNHHYKWSIILCDQTHSHDVLYNTIISK
jgi:hypothetical protein